MSDAFIEPRLLKGFRDYLPEAMLPREQIMETARRVYRSFGFAPIDTPALEYLEILAKKGGDESDKQMYRFQDSGERWVGMRFDLTVPLARFAAQHLNEIGLPFKRYHLGTVWRGENTQRGRYREFMQCDFDTLGTLSPVADIETVLVVHELLRALGLDAFKIRINHRGVLNGLLAGWGLELQTGAVLRSLDKLNKIGPARVLQELTEQAEVGREQAEQILQLAELKGDNASILAGLEALARGQAAAEAGVERLNAVLSAATAGGVPPDKLLIDPAIARGLDYYTGLILETFLDELPEIGSICSGGRYDNLAALFTKKQLPGIGASLGLDRLLAALEELGRLERKSTPAQVFVPYFVAGRLNDYLTLAQRLRLAGFPTELYPEPKRLGDQLKYADRKGFAVAVIAGEDELVAGQCQVKDLRTGGSKLVPLQDAEESLFACVKQLLAGTGPLSGKE